jgi:hypothetical protein|nr:MAG TPA: inhibitor [Caudoviricetes sp.]
MTFDYNDYKAATKRLQRISEFVVKENPVFKRVFGF